MYLTNHTVEVRPELFDVDLRQCREENAGGVGLGYPLESSDKSDIWNNSILSNNKITHYLTNLTNFVL